ncbi:MAG: di-heme oxidoredictase family protein [Steroidobacteraceae bacterium]
MKYAAVFWFGCLFSAACAAPTVEAPTGFDGASNGLVSQATHDGDREEFDEFETIEDGLGPLYNAQACRECHQDPISGGASQVTELRAGHRGKSGQFENPEIPISRGDEIIRNRSLVNDRAICPNDQFPASEIHERVPEREHIRTLRVSITLLGDGFVEAVADQTLIDLARQQCRASGNKICGQVIRVPIVEAPGETGVGRFGWKNQHASLLSFSADAYLNEMGITSELMPDEVTRLCDTAAQPNDTPDDEGLAGIDRFARFIRATKAPARDAVLAAGSKARLGAKLFDKAGCAACHVPALVTSPAGTKINGGKFTVPAALGSKTFHPYSDFLLHDINTGDGIVMAMEEHYGRNMYQIQWKDISYPSFRTTANKMRTAPLWGLRLRTRLMHDGASVTPADAIARHGKEGEQAARNFAAMGSKDREALLTFLDSL